MTTTNWPALDAQQLNGPERGYSRRGQGGGLLVANAIGDGGQRLCLRARPDRRIFGIGTVRSGYAEDAGAGAQIVSLRRNPLDDTGEVGAEDEGIGRAGGQAGQVVVVDRIDPGIAHLDQERVRGSRNWQVMDGRSLPPAANSERPHMSLLTYQRT